MPYEVEQKFPVDDLEAVRSKLAGLGAEWSGPRKEVDLYFAHPSRDFAATDEALRIRRVGGASRITYKGPKIDPTTKTRREIELPLSNREEETAAWQALIEALGFTPRAEVRKGRLKAKVPWHDRRIEASLDDVTGVGTFVELELMADESDLDAARATIASLAQHLGLTTSERRSYLELLLEGRGD